MELRINLFAMHELEPSLFENFFIPEGLDKEVLVENLLLETYDFPIIYTEPRQLKLFLSMWSRKQLPVWQKLYDTTQYEYNPISNYDRTEYWYDNKLERESEDTRNGREQNIKSNDYRQNQQYTSDNVEYNSVESRSTDTDTSEHTFGTTDTTKDTVTNDQKNTESQKEIDRSTSETEHDTEHTESNENIRLDADEEGHEDTESHVVETRDLKGTVDTVTTNQSKATETRDLTEKEHGVETTESGQTETRNLAGTLDNTTTTNEDKLETRNLQGSSLETRNLKDTKKETYGSTENRNSGGSDTTNHYVAAFNDINNQAHYELALSTSDVIQYGKTENIDIKGTDDYTIDYTGTDDVKTTDTGTVKHDNQDKSQIVQDTSDTGTVDTDLRKDVTTDTNKTDTGTVVTDTNSNQNVDQDSTDTGSIVTDSNGTKDTTLHREEDTAKQVVSDTTTDKSRNEVEKTLEKFAEKVDNTINSSEHGLETDNHSKDFIGQEKENTNVNDTTESVLNSAGVENTNRNQNVQDESRTGRKRDGQESSLHKGKIYGNIGVTTTQEMIRQERDISKYNMYDVIIRDFKKRFCIVVY